MTTKSSIDALWDTINGKSMYFGILTLTSCQEKLTIRIQGGDKMYDDICERIKANRKRMGLTQTQLGKALGVQKSAIQKYESGSNHYKLETIIKLAQVFEISVSTLIGEHPSETEMQHTLIEMYGAKGVAVLEVFQVLDDRGKAKLLTYALDILPNYSSHTTMKQNGDGI